MHALETEIATPEASRYLLQVCKHWRHKLAVTFTPAEARVPFDENSVCLMAATTDTLKLRVEAAAPAAAERLADVVVNHLQRFAHKSPLPTPVWRAA